MKTQFLNTLQDGTTHILTFPRLKTGFLSISKSKSFHVSNSHFWKFRNLNTRFLSINPIAWQHCPFLNVSQPEYTILENQKTDPLAGLHYLYLNIWRWKLDSWAVGCRPHCRTSQTICELFVVWKRDFKSLRYWSLWRTKLLISARFAVLKLDPTHKQINHLSGHHWTFAACILQDVTAHIWTFRSLKTAFLTISKSTPLHFGWAHFWIFRSLRTQFRTSSNRPP